MKDFYSSYIRRIKFIRSIVKLNFSTVEFNFSITKFNFSTVELNFTNNRSFRSGLYRIASRLYRHRKWLR